MRFAGEGRVRAPSPSPSPSSSLLVSRASKLCLPIEAATETGEESNVPNSVNEGGRLFALGERAWLRMLYVLVVDRDADRVTRRTVTFGDR